MRASPAPLLVAAWAIVAASLHAATELPCPDAKPAFDHTAIDRSLREPTLGSATPAYRFMAFGPQGKTIVAFVADESKGTGTGVDTLYIDLNANHDITEPGERVALAKAQPVRPVRGAAPHLVLVTLSAWGKEVLRERPLAVPDPTFDYRLYVGSSFMRVITATRDGSWSVPLHIYGPSVPWSTSRRDAPVFRFGGKDFHLRNESSVVRTVRGRHQPESGVGRTLRPGAFLRADAVTPFFAGSSPEAVFAQGRCWVPGGHGSFRAWLEATGDGGEPLVTDIVLRGY